MHGGCADVVIKEPIRLQGRKDGMRCSRSLGEKRYLKATRRPHEIVIRNKVCGAEVVSFANVEQQSVPYMSSSIRSRQPMRTWRDSEKRAISAEEIDAYPTGTPVTSLIESNERSSAVGDTIRDFFFFHHTYILSTYVNSYMDLSEKRKLQ